VKFSSWRSMQIGAAYVGAVIGAGFASGQEIVQFFLVFGVQGIWGLAFIGAAFAVFGTAVLFLIEKYNVETYQEMINLLFGKRIGWLFDVWITLFLFAGLCVMLAGGTAIFVEHLNLPGVWGLGITAGGVAAGIIGQGKGIMRINSLLMPFLLLASVGVGLTAVFYGGSPINPHITPPVSAGKLVGGNWLTAAVLYVSYNMIIGMVILSSLGKRVVAGNAAGGALGGMFLGAVALIIGLGLLSFPDAFFYEIPMIYVAGRTHPLLKLYYVFVLWLALLTTAIADGYGLAKRVSQAAGWNGQLVGLVILIAALPFAPIGFTNMVATFYPLFGYAGLPILAAIIARLGMGAFNRKSF
jgi:uncharacterized membrane protein YkvI